MIIFSKMNKIKEQRIFKVGFIYTYCDVIEYVLVSADSILEAHDIAKEYLRNKFSRFQEIKSIQEESYLILKTNN